MAIFKGAKNRDDHFAGSDASDRFVFDPAELTAGDFVSGGDGAGNDVLVFTKPGAISAEALANVSGIEVIRLADGGASIVLTQQLADTASVRGLVVSGGTGNDMIDGHLIGNHDFAAGYLTLAGNEGNDTLLGGPDSRIILDGGAGRDTIDGVRGTVVYDGADVHAIMTDYAVLQVNGAARIDLTRISDQSFGDRSVVQGFSIVDASNSTEHVSLIGAAGDELYGGSASDRIVGGSRIAGGGGADILIGALSNTTFELQHGDFADGEKIVGRADYDRLEVHGSLDLRGGTIRGIDALTVFSDNEKHVRLAIDGSVANQLRYFTFVNEGGDASVAIDIYLRQATSFVPEQLFNGYELDVHGSSGDDIAKIYQGAIHGRGGDDQIEGAGRLAGGTGDDMISGQGYLIGGAGNDDITTKSGQDFGSSSDAHEVYGGSGDDHITVEIPVRGDTIDGGFGNDSLVLFNSGVTQVDLASKGDQTLDDNIVVSNFENIDLSGSFGECTVTGSAKANIIYGSGENNKLYGEGGDDVLRVGGEGSVASGGSGDDVIISLGIGKTMLTGGGGMDTFRWVEHSQFDPDVITDFRSGQDHLEFDASVFSFSGDSFDHLVVAQDKNADITGADLVIYTGKPLDNGQDVVAFLDSVRTGERSGIFVLGTDSDAHTVLYHAFRADGGHVSSLDVVVDLGTAVDPTNLTLTDFSFI